MTQVSVIMSVYNDKIDDIRKTINSIDKQSFKDYEFIIVNDGSNKKTSDFLKLLSNKKIRIIENKRNIGLTKSLNNGLTKARGKYIARIDAGDTAESTRLEKQVTFLEKNPDYGIVGTWTKIYDKKGKLLRKVKNYEKDANIRKIITYKNQFVHSSLMFKKNLGLYDDKFKYAQDYELVLRIMKNNKGHNIPEYLTNYVYDSQSISFKKSREQEYYALKAIKKSEEYGYKKNPKVIITKIIYYLPPSIKKIYRKFLYG